MLINNEPQLAYSPQPIKKMQTSNNKNYKNVLL